MAMPLKADCVTAYGSLQTAVLSHAGPEQNRVL